MNLKGLNLLNFTSFIVIQPKTPTSLKYSTMTIIEIKNKISPNSMCSKINLKGAAPRKRSRATPIITNVSLFLQYKRVPRTASTNTVSARASLKATTGEFMSTSHFTFRLYFLDSSKRGQCFMAKVSCIFSIALARGPWGGGTLKA